MKPLDIISDEQLMLKAAREGINKSTYEFLRKITGFNKVTMARLAHISSRTLERTKSDTKIRPEASERAILIGKTAYLGNDTFGSKEKFNEWLNTPHQIFHDEKPIAYLSTLTGINKVIEELYRIQHGIY